MSPLGKTASEFGSVLKTLRMLKFKSLREFAGTVGCDPVLINKWELGLAQPPDESKVRFIAQQLGLVEGSPDWTSFLDAANRERDSYNPAPMNDEMLLSKMPASFRGLRVGESPKDIIDESKRIAEAAYKPNPKA